MKALLAVFLSSFVISCGAEEAAAPVQPQTDPPDIKIAKECLPKGAGCFLIPGSAMQELENRFSTLRNTINEQREMIKELKEYQSKTCI